MPFDGEQEERLIHDDVEDEADSENKEERPYARTKEDREREGAADRRVGLVDDVLYERPRARRSARRIPSRRLTKLLGSSKSSG